MNKRQFKIEDIPAVIWGEKKSRVFIAVHGNMSDKEDLVIQLLAEKVVKKGYQVISFDLPQHGDRKEENKPFKVQFCIEELKKIMYFANQHWENISLFGCSLGTYFSLLAYKEENLEQCLFLSPVLDMERIINNMMKWFNITTEELQDKNEIETPIGEVLYWDYYTYVKEHPVDKWNTSTAILYGAKDNVSEFEIIENFSQKFGCDIEIMQKGEHYFHTNEQLNVYKEWINKHISDKY